MYTPTDLRTWHSRGTLDYSVDTRWDYTCANVALIPRLIRRWLKTDSPDELDSDLVDLVFGHPEISHRVGAMAGERLRISKLCLDAAREIYHLAALDQLIPVSYSEADDLNGVDVRILIRHLEIPVQITMDTQNLWGRTKFHRRMVRGAMNEPLVVSFVPGDRRWNPWVPELAQYAQLVAELSARFRKIAL